VKGTGRHFDVKRQAEPEFSNKAYLKSKNTDTGELSEYEVEFF